MEEVAGKPGRHIGFLCEGDAGSYHAFSGTAKGIVDHLRLLGDRVVCMDARPSAPLRLANALLTWSPNRDRWRARFRYGEFAFNARSRRAIQTARDAAADFDVIFQIGATFAPPSLGAVPYVLYCDWNMALSIRNKDKGRASTAGITDGETRAINQLQAKIYQGAGLIFTICERLRHSFVEDYGLPAERIVRAYPGVNFNPQHVRDVASNRNMEGPPTILFIGREFERKGGPTLVHAFRLLRQNIPDAKLVIIGADNAPCDEPGVENLGTLRKSIPSEMDRLLRAFATASVFCLPSRLDPFPNVVREAMIFGLPCVTTDIWAFPEMVLDGKTGFTVPPDDPAVLSARLEQLLRDKDLAGRMGAAGRCHAEAEFTWTGCAATIKSAIEERIFHLKRTRN